MHVDCFSGLLLLACLLPLKEDNLRNQITKFLLAVSESFWDSCLTHIMLPVFTVGDDADLTFFPPNILSRIKGLRPRTTVAEKLATLGILPLLLADVLGFPGKQELLAHYLTKLLVKDAMKENQSALHNIDIVNAVRFLCTFEEHHGMIFNILWEMAVPYIDAKVASTHFLPSLITLGSDQNLNVEYASIEAFGAVAQHFKNDLERIVDKKRVEMDAFLEDESHEAAIVVVRSLVMAIPRTTERLRDYLLSKIFQLTSTSVSATDVMHRRQRANAFCEAIRAVDATDFLQIAFGISSSYHIKLVKRP